SPTVAFTPRATSTTPVGAVVRTAYEQREPVTYAPSRVSGGAIPTPGGMSSTRLSANSSTCARTRRAPAVPQRNPPTGAPRATRAGAAGSRYRGPTPIGVGLGAPPPSAPSSATTTAPPSTNRG